MMRKSINYSIKAKYQVYHFLFVPRFDYSKVYAYFCALKF